MSNEYNLTDWLGSRTIYGNHYRATIWHDDSRRDVWCVRVLWLDAAGRRWESRMTTGQTTQEATRKMIDTLNELHPVEP